MMRSRLHDTGSILISRLDLFHLPRSFRGHAAALFAKILSCCKFLELFLPMGPELLGPTIRGPAPAIAIRAGDLVIATVTVDRPASNQNPSCSKRRQKLMMITLLVSPSLFVPVARCFTHAKYQLLGQSPCKLSSLQQRSGKFSRVQETWGLSQEVIISVRA